MSKIEVLKLALEALETSMYPQQKQLQAITAIKKALAEDALQRLSDIHQEMEAQQPVGEAYLCDACDTPFDGAYYCPSPTCGHNTSTKQSVYTSPPQRKERK